MRAEEIRFEPRLEIARYVSRLFGTMAVTALLRLDRVRCLDGPLYARKKNRGEMARGGD